MTVANKLLEEQLQKYYEWKGARKAFVGRVIETKRNVPVDEETTRLSEREVQALNEFKGAMHRR